MLLQTQGHPQEKCRLEDFFQVLTSKKHSSSSSDEQEMMEEQQQKEEEEEYLFQEEDIEFIYADEVDPIKEAIDTVNHRLFKLVSLTRFPSANSFVQSISINEASSHILLTCSDRVMRLYEIKYENVGLRKRVVFLKNEFQDVINRRKWMNSCFLKLNRNTKIAEQQSVNKTDMLNQIINETKQQFQLQDSKHLHIPVQPQHEDLFLAEQEQEIFVSSIGESGSNELKFYHVHDFSVIQRLELSQEGCCQLTAHSRAHFSIIMVTTNGSLFLWSVRPSKIIQPLAPYFNEIDENKEYKEREEEFDREMSDNEEQND